MGNYHTPEQLRTQIEVARRQIAVEENRLKIVQSPDWPLAKDYGEGVRKNHIDAISRRIKHLQHRIEVIQMALPKVEE